MNGDETATDTSCPVCGSALAPVGRSYSVEELFSLWEPMHRFSDGVAVQHREQSSSTRLHVCPGCLLGIYLPRIIGTRAFYEELGANMEYYSDSKWDFTVALRDCKACDSLIEIGCGPGSFLRLASQKVPQVYGTELNEDARRVAQSQGFSAFGAADIPERLRGHLAAAFSFHVLEHVEDPMAFMRELCSWIRPGGKIGLSVPNQDGPVKYIDPCIMNMPPHHATRWRLPTLRILADRLGMEIKRVAYEPLLLRSHYYYSSYWIRQKCQGRTHIHRAGRALAERGLRRFFELMSKTGAEYFPLLRGQSIYVLMTSARAGRNKG